MNFNKKQGPSNKGSFGTDTVKLGGGQMALCAAAVIIAVLINLIAGRLPAGVTKYDLSSAGYFTLSEQSKSIVSSLSQPVTLYLVAEKGDENATITSLLEKYKQAGGSNISIEYIDPVLHPTFMQKYDSEAPSANSVIVDGGSRFRIVDYNDIYLSDYSNYYTTGQVGMSFDGEGAITSALAYVSTDDLPMVYALGGHGELTIPDNIKTLMAKDNFTLDTVNLLTSGEIPADCDALIILSPQMDLTAGEAQTIINYMEKGGSVLIFADITTTEMPNLDSLLDAYGLRLERGIIYERNGSNYLTGNYYQYLLPNMNSHEITLSMMQNGQFALLPMAQGILSTDSHRSSLNIQHILTTSSQSYLKTVDRDISTAEKEDGDIDGPFGVATVVTEEVSGGTTHLALFSTSYLMEESIDNLVYSGNSNLIMSTMGWLCQYEQSMSIHAKPVDAEILVIPGSSYNIMSIAVVIVLPLAALGIGAVVTLSRRKR